MGDLGCAGSSGGAKSGGLLREHERGVIKYRYRTHPAILANIQLASEPADIEARPKIASREASEQPLPPNGGLLLVGRDDEQPRQAAIGSGQLWADQTQVAGLPELPADHLPDYASSGKLRRVVVIEKGDEVRQFDNDDTANSLKLTDGETFGQVLVTQVEPRSEAHRRGIRAGDQLLAVNGQPVETARQAGRLIERQADQLRLIYLAASADKEQQFVHTNAIRSVPSIFHQEPSSELDRFGWTSNSSNLAANNGDSPATTTPRLNNIVGWDDSSIIRAGFENSKERLKEKLDSFIEQYLDESDKLNLSYYLNEFETNNCDLSDLLANLLQNLLIKLPNAFVKYKLLDYIKQIYVEPAMRSLNTSDRANGNDDNGLVVALNGKQSNDLPAIDLNGNENLVPTTIAATTTIESNHLDSNKHQVDLRLFEAMQWRYLLASNALMRSPLGLNNSRLSADSAEMQKKRRRKQRAAELQLLRGLQAQSSGANLDWQPQVNCCQPEGETPFRRADLGQPANSLKPNNWPPSVQFNGIGEPANEKACQLLSDSTSDELGVPRQRRHQEQQQFGVRNLGDLDLAECSWWSSSAAAQRAIIDWSPASKRPSSSAACISLIDYHSNQTANDKALTADNNSSNYLYPNQNNVHGSRENKSSSSNYKKASLTSNAQLDDSYHHRGRSDLWPVGLYLADREEPASPGPDVAGVALADRRLFGRHRNSNPPGCDNKQSQLMQASTRPGWPNDGRQLALPGQLTNHYLPETAPANALSASLDSLAQPPRQTAHRFWRRNNGGHYAPAPVCSSVAADSTQPLSTDEAFYLRYGQPPPTSSSRQIMADPLDRLGGSVGRRAPHSDDMALLDYRADDQPLEGDPLRPSSCFSLAARNLPGSFGRAGLGAAGFGQPPGPNMDMAAARRASHDNQELSFKQSVVGGTDAWPAPATVHYNPEVLYCIDNNKPANLYESCGITQGSESGVRFSGEHLTRSGGSHYYYDGAAEALQLLMPQASSIKPTAIEPPSANKIALGRQYTGLAQADYRPPGINSICPYIIGQQHRNQSQADCIDWQSATTRQPGELGWQSASGLLQPELGGSQQDLRCCSASSKSMPACGLPNFISFPQAGSIQQWHQRPTRMHPCWHANSASAVSLQSIDVDSSQRLRGIPPSEPSLGVCSAGQNWPPEGPEVGRHAQGGTSARLERTSYNQTLARYEQHQQATWSQPHTASPEFGRHSAHDKLAPFIGQQRSEGFSCKIQPTHELTDASGAYKSQPRRRRQRRQTSGCSTGSPVHHHNQHHLGAGDDNSGRLTTNQLKDGLSQAGWNCCNDNLNEGGPRHHHRQRHEQQERSSAASSQAVNHFHRYDYDQYDVDADEDDYDHDSDQEPGLTAVPVQAKGRLSMSVAEQMKEQASAFVHQYSSSCTNRLHSGGQRPKARQKPNLQVRRKLRVKIKKSKPILGIAIEGGFNVSGQLLPRIVCVHEDGAAYQCGKLRASDLILEVNGKSTVNMTHDEIAKTIATAYYQDQHSHIEFLIGESVQCIS